MTRSTRRLLLSLLILTTLPACASHPAFDRPEMQDVMRQTVILSVPQAAPGEPEAAPAISSPFRLSFFFTRKEFPTKQAIKPVEWLSQDKHVLLRALAPLQNEHILRNSLVIADLAVQESSLTEIRKAAARYGADMIVIVTGVGAVDRSNNGYAALYPTILGAYLAPGTVSEALVLIEGSLWDVRSGFSYGTLKAEGQSRLVGPVMSIEDRDALMQGKHRALETFSAQLVERLRLLMPSQQRGAHSQP